MWLEEYEKRGKNKILSKTELLFLKGELKVNPNYERVLACRIKKKIEKRIQELTSILPLLQNNEKLNGLMKHYRKLVTLQENSNIEKSLKNGYFEEKEALNGRMLVAGRGFEPRISGL